MIFTKIIIRDGVPECSVHDNTLNRWNYPCFVGKMYQYGDGWIFSPAPILNEIGGIPEWVVQAVAKFMREAREVSHAQG